MNCTSRGWDCQVACCDGLVRDEVVRRMPAPPVYDLHFDLVLQEALRLLRQGLVPAHDAQQLLAPAAAAS